MDKSRLQQLAGVLIEHKDWMTEADTESVCKTVVDHLKSEAAKYEKRDDYKGDDPIKHVCDEFCEMLKENLGI